MATYQEIQTYVKQIYGFEPKTCWIAHVKELSSLPVRRAWNSEGKERKVPCPTKKVEIIQEAFKHFKMMK